MLPAIPSPVTPTDPGADLLDRRHQRPGEQHDPSHAVTELRADLRIGRDAAWIVVGGAGDQTRAQKSQEPPASRLPGNPMVRDAGRECHRGSGAMAPFSAFGGRGLAQFSRYSRKASGNGKPNSNGIASP